MLSRFSLCLKKSNVLIHRPFIIGFEIHLKAGIPAGRVIENGVQALAGFDESIFGGNQSFPGQSLALIRNSAFQILQIPLRM